MYVVQLDYFFWLFFWFFVEEVAQYLSFFGHLCFGIRFTYKNTGIQGTVVRYWA